MHTHTLTHTHTHTCAHTTGVDEVQDDEALMDQAVVGGVFAFLRRCVQAQHFHSEEYFVKKLHWLVTSMVVNMPLKVCTCTCTLYIRMLFYCMCTCCNTHFLRRR